MLSLPLKLALSIVVMMGLSVAADLQEVVFYSCDFDGNDCSYSSNRPGSVSLKSSFEYSNIHVTDYTATHKPTKSDKKCKIPFEIDNQKYHYCTKENKCQTEEGAMAECSTGQLLSARSSKNDGLELLIINFPPVDIIKAGQHQLCFYAFADCQIPTPNGCDDLKDYITLNVDAKELLKVPLKDLVTNKGWNKFTVNFNVTNPSFKFAFTNRRHLFSDDNKIYFGIDEITVKTFEEVPTTTATTTPSTTAGSTTTTTPTTTTTSSAPFHQQSFLLVSLALVAFLKLMS